ncbi:MAG: VWA domain-containing protein [Candidatus Alcyoniella australis]|nr:VWA domain-containing protein [Candidatus Alcyoniella australis]
MIFAGISLAQFAALFGGGSAFIVLVYLLRFRRRGKLISSDLIWRRVLIRQRTILNELLSILVQILLLLLICLALLDPRTEVEQVRPRLIVIGIDTSLSMAAREPGGARIDLARRQARELLDNLGPNDEALLLAAGDRVSALTGFSSRRSVLDAALKSIQPAGVDGDLRQVLEYARDAFAFRAPPENAQRLVVIFSDRPAPKLEDDEPTLQWVRIGSSLPNLAITAFDVRQTFNQAPGNEVFVRVVNFSDTAANATLNVYTPDKLVGREALALQPGGEFHKVYFLPIEVSGRLVAGLNDAQLESGADALVLDDMAYAVLPGAEPVDVLLVTRENRYVRSALEINPLVRLRNVSPEGFTASQARGADVVILDRVSAGEVPAHTVEIFPPTGGAFDAAQPVEQPVLTSWDGEHPLLRYVTLGDLEIGEARPLQARPGDKSLIDTFEGSLLLVRRDGRFNRVALGFDLTRSDLPLRVAFPVFMHNMVWWLGGMEASQLPSRTPVGQSATIATSGDLEQLTLVGPSDREYVAAGGAGRVSFMPPLPGFYSYDLGEGAPRWCAASLINPRESDLSVAADADGAIELAAAVQIPQQRVFWPWLALMALLLAAGDWVLFHGGRLA